LRNLRKYRELSGMKKLSECINESMGLTKRYSMDKVYDLMNDLDDGEFVENEVQKVIDYFVKIKRYKQMKSDDKNFAVKLQSSENNNQFIYFQLKKDKWGNDPMWKWELK
jgi:hypothetical protein